MFGLKRHRPPFVVVAVTEGALPGYSNVRQVVVNLRLGTVSTFGKLDGELEEITIRIVDVLGLGARASLTSKKPNSYGVSGGPMIRALTFRTSTSLHATARAFRRRAC